MYIYIYRIMHLKIMLVFVEIPEATDSFANRAHLAASSLNKHIPSGVIQAPLRKLAGREVQEQVLCYSTAFSGGWVTGSSRPPELVFQV